VTGYTRHAMQGIYMDHNSTTPLDCRVLEAMTAYLREEYGNPSCTYGLGVAANHAIQKARLQVAKLIGAKDREITFTSGGTESNNLALRSAVRAMGRKQIITTVIEHPAILRTCEDLEHWENCTVSYLAVDRQGRVDPERVYRSLTTRTAIVSVMTANNEIGTIQPIAAIGRLLSTEDVLFHTDAVQAVGRVPLNVAELGVDMLSLSAHKMYGPKGVGALYVREGTPYRPVQTGGDQELGRRAGTENVAGIVGLGVAADLAQQEMEKRAGHVRALVERLWGILAASIPGLFRNSPEQDCLPGTLNVSIPGVRGRDVVRELDRAGICVSTGSACSEGEPCPSHVVLATSGDEERALTCIRFSLGAANTAEQVDQVGEILPKAIAALRKKGI